MASINHTPGNRRGSTGKVWSTAVLLTFVMHGVVLGALWILRPFTPTPVQAKSSDPIELVFVSAPEAEKEPNFFSELPPEMADVAPEDPDFLSNIDSRARDEASGTTDGSLPRLEGTSEAPHVALAPGDPSPAQPEAAEQTPQEQEPDPELLGSEIVKKQEPQPPVPDSKLLLERPDGNVDFLQDAMDNPDGGTPLFGGISLNTVAWDYAPWLQRFVRDFIRDWRAPPAYHMGMIHGSHVLKLVILSSGELARLAVVSQDGSEALVQTSSRTFEILAPFQPLPKDFPEETLTIDFTLTYPKIVRAPSRQTIPQNRRRSGSRRQTGS